MYRVCLLVVGLCWFVLVAGAQVDTTIGLSASHGDAKNYKDLAHALCDGVSGERLKANAIYNWITHNIKYNIKAVESGKVKPDKVEKVLKNRLAVCDGYAKLYTAMCKEVGLKAVSIDGYAKDWIFDNGDQLIIPRHEWCAVLIDSAWQLVDPTWGAGNIVQAPTVLRKIINKITFKKVTYAKKLKFVFKYDTQYFAQSPDSFRFKHLPSDPQWQLMDTAMPLAVFEAGDSAVAAFTQVYHKRSTHDTDLLRIARLEPDSVVLDAATRAYEFNNKFAVALALRQNARVLDDLKKVDSEKDIEKGKALWKDAERALKVAEVHIKDQKKYFPEQYTMLKKKNRTKNSVAKQDMMRIKTDDKKMLAQCGKYRHTSDVKLKRVNKKYGDAEKRRRGLDPGKIRDVAASKSQKDPAAEDMVAIRDSIKARSRRIDSMQADIDQRTVVIKALRDSNSTRLDSLAKCLGVSDSFLVNEAKARLHMHDSYDDDVIKWGTLFKGEKYQKADTLQLDYLAAYDTIIAKSDDRQKVRVGQMDCYKKNLADAEKYAKWNSKDTTIPNKYVEMALAYSNVIDSSTHELQVTANYVRGHKALFYGLAKLYKRQLLIVKYMGNVEDIRKKLEMNAIAGKQAFDNNENKQQLAGLKNAVKKMERVYK